jgi:hypothetical protein
MYILSGPLLMIKLSSRTLRGNLTLRKLVTTWGQSFFRSEVTKMESEVSLLFQNNPPFPPVLFASLIQHTLLHLSPLKRCNLGLCLRIGFFSSGIPNKIVYDFCRPQSVINFSPIAFLIIFSEKYEL